MCVFGAMGWGVFLYERNVIYKREALLLLFCRLGGKERAAIYKQQIMALLQQKNQKG